MIELARVDLEADDTVIFRFNDEGGLTMYIRNVSNSIGGQSISSDGFHYAPRRDVVRAGASHVSIVDHRIKGGTHD